MNSLRESWFVCRPATCRVEMFLLGLGLIGFPVLGRSNPVPVHHQVYLASEDLAIAVDDDRATIVGHFTLRSAPHSSLHSPSSPIHFSVPVWVPAPASKTSGDLGRFQSLLSTTNRYVLAEGADKRLADAVTGLSVRLDGEPLNWTTFSWREERGSVEANDALSVPLYRVEFNYGIPPDRLADGGNLSLAYRQPLVRDGEDRWLYYVPYLPNLPSGEGSGNIEDYRIRVMTSKPARLEARSPLRHLADRTSNELVILPQDRKPILVQVAGRGDRDLGTLFYQHQRWATREWKLVFRNEGYIVEAGDTFARIARRYGIALGDLLALNGTLDPRRLPVGGVVRIQP